MNVKDPFLFILAFYCRASVSRTVNTAIWFKFKSAAEGVFTPSRCTMPVQWLYCVCLRVQCCSIYWTAVSNPHTLYHRKQQLLRIQVITVFSSVLTVHIQIIPTLFVYQVCHHNNLTVPKGVGVKHSIMKVMYCNLNSKNTRQSPLAGSLGLAAEGALWHFLVYTMLNPINVHVEGSTCTRKTRVTIHNLYSSSHRLCRLMDPIV